MKSDSHQSTGKYKKKRPKFFEIDICGPQNETQIDQSTNIILISEPPMEDAAEELQPEQLKAKPSPSPIRICKQSSLKTEEKVHDDDKLEPKILDSGALKQAREAPRTSREINMMQEIKLFSPIIISPKNALLVVPEQPPKEVLIPQLNLKKEILVVEQPKPKKEEPVVQRDFKNVYLTSEFLNATPKPPTLEISADKLEISRLKSMLQERDREIEFLKSELLKHENKQKS